MLETGFDTSLYKRDSRDLPEQIWIKTRLHVLETVTCLKLQA